MKTILIWDDKISGHHLEYIHHIYNAAVCEPAHFVFVLPNEFKERKNMMKWKNGKNITFDYMNEDELANLNGNYFLSSFKRSRCIRKYVLKYNADELFLITLCLPYPFLPFVLPRVCKISGIIYQIYFYKWREMPFAEKAKYVLETLSMAKTKSTKHPLVLNDPSATNYFNRLFSVSKYRNVVDPIKPLDDVKFGNREKYDLGDKDVVFFHFGAMDVRKGTLDLLKAITLLKKEQMQNRVFIFAGKVSKTIKTKFYNLVNQAKENGARILVYDEFCEFSFLNELCSISDYLVIPYRNTELSSGVIGYAAQFGKRLIGPAEGVIGKLIRQNKGSISIKRLTPEKIAREISLGQRHACTPNKAYMEKNSVNNFQKKVMEILLN